MIDETGQAGAPEAVRADKQINAKGNNDQWRRHLEKAYFERQRAAMQGQTSGDKQSASLQRSESANEGRGRPSGADTRASAGQATPGHDARASSSAATQAGSSVESAVVTATGRARSPAASAAASAQSRTTVQHRSGDAVAATRPAMAAWRGALPATSSASVLQSERGAHVVIRDTSLTTQAARQLLGRLRALFAAEGQRLWALTLNGERLWQLREDFEAAQYGGIDHRF